MAGSYVSCSYSTGFGKNSTWERKETVGTSDETWEELNEKAMSIIQFCLECTRSKNSCTFTDEIGEYIF